MLFVVTSVANGSDWAHNAIDLTHKYGDGSGVKVGVLDGGVRCSHQELKGHCLNTFYTDTPSYTNHGTHVATIIAGRDKAPDWLNHDGGVAPNATIHSYEVFGSGDWWISDENEAKMVYRAASDGVSVINMSYGAYDGQGRAALPDALVDVWRSHKNITFVNAAGNDGTLLDPGNVDNLKNVIFVGATDQSGNITSWSNTPGNNYKNQFIVAPGDYISGAFAGSDNDYGHMSGTSMAAPIVTGVIAILHDHWGHLKNNPSATAGVLFDSAIDKGAKGVDSVYGHGMLNVLGIWEPLPIKDPGDPIAEPCEEIIIIDDPIISPPIGTPGDGVWYDDRGDRKMVKSGCNPDFEQPPILDPDQPEPPILIPYPPIDDCGDWNCGGTIGTPGDGVWYDDRGNRNFFLVKAHGDYKVLKRVRASSTLMGAASNLSLVFFDRYGRDYKTRAANYYPTSRTTTDYMNLSDTTSMQLVSGRLPNFKIQAGDDISVGRGRTAGMNYNPVMETLDDGVFVTKDNVGFMYADTSKTVFYQPEDWWTLSYTKEDGFLGSTGLGNYDTIASTWSKDYGMFFGSTTLAVSEGGSDKGLVRMSDRVSTMAFETGLKGEIKKNLNWKFTVSQALQPLDGSMSVDYSVRGGRTVTNTIDLGDYRTTKVGFQINFTW